MSSSIGTRGSLTGYSLEIERKKYLSKLDRVNMKYLQIPKKGIKL